MKIVILDHTDPDTKIRSKFICVPYRAVLVPSNSKEIVSSIEVVRWVLMEDLARSLCRTYV